MIAVVLKGLATRKVRALLTALAVVIGVSMVSGTLILTDTTQRAGLAIDDGSTSTIDAAIFEKQLVKGSRAANDVTMPASFLEKVRKLPGVAAARGDVMPQAEPHVADIIGRDGRPAEVAGLGRGIDPDALALSPVKAGAFGPLTLDSGAWPEGPRQVVVNRRTAAAQHYAVGDRVVIATATGRHGFTLAGIVSYAGEDLPPQPSLAVWDDTTAARVLDRRGRYDVISIDAVPGTTGADVASAVRPLLPANLQAKDTVSSERSAEREWNDSMATIRSFLLVFGGIALVVGAFVIFNALSITVAQRTRELATLRTLGASRRQVMRSVLVEGLVLGVIASLLGLVLGLGIAKAMMALVGGLGLDLPEGAAVVAPHTVVASLAVGTLVTLVASLLPARRATRVPPIAAVREGATLPSRTRVIGRLVAPLVRVVGWPARRVGGVAGELAGANAVRNPGRTAATAAALTIGLMLVTLVAILGSGINAGTKGAVRDQVAAGHVVAGKHGDPFRDLGPVPGTVVSQVRSDTAVVQGRETSITGIDPATIARQYRFDWTAGSLAGLDTGGAVVTEEYARGRHLVVGSRLAVKTPAGDSYTLVVRGIYDAPDEKALLGSVSVSQAAFDEAWKRPLNSLALVDAEAAALPALRAAVARIGDAEVYTSDGYADAATKDMDTFIAMLYALLGFSVIVSLFGMANTLVLSVFERTRELGMLRAIGMSRGQARRMIRHESVITALLGAAAGLGAGGIIAVVVLARAGVPLAIPVPTLAAFTLVAVLLGVAAAVLPARRAAQLNVLDALKYE
jgi:putative ABC transport system permease protein